VLGIPQTLEIFGNNEQGTKGTKVNSIHYTHARTRTCIRSRVDLPLGTLGTPQAKSRCALCHREAENVDRDEHQCARCNGDWLHEQARRALVATLPPESALAYMHDEEVALVPLSHFPKAVPPMTDKPKPEPVPRETPPPDWLTAQAKAIGTARPKKPRSAYQRRWR
jgi:hypothetical protein